MPRTHQTRHRPTNVPVAPRPCPLCGKPARDRGIYCGRACWLVQPWVNAAPIPTPEEIADRAAEIQAEWSDEERARRARPEWRRVTWLPPVVEPLGAAEPVREEE